MNKNLKNGMVRSLKIKQDDFGQTKTYFNQCLEDIEIGKTKLLLEDEYKEKMDFFMSKLEQRYSNEYQIYNLK